MVSCISHLKTDIFVCHNFINFAWWSSVFLHNRWNSWGREVAEKRKKRSTRPPPAFPAGQANPRPLLGPGHRSSLSPPHPVPSSSGTSSFASFRFLLWSSLLSGPPWPPPHHLQLCSCLVHCLLACSLSTSLIGLELHEVRPHTCLAHDCIRSP